MDHVLTLIAAPGRLVPTQAAAVRHALAALGATLGATDWLAPGEAVDVQFTGLAPDQAASAARTALAGAAVDAIAQPLAGRRKQLLLADMDSTIVTTETLDELAAAAGLKHVIAAITRRSMNGELDFATALRQRVAMLRGLPLAALETTWRATALTAGAADLIATMRAHGAVTALVSGGFTFFTERVATQLGIDHHFANILEHDGAALTGTVVEPILDRDAKLATLKRLAAAQGVPLSAAAAVGDGANDLAMLAAAGLGVAFRAKPVVAASARARLDHADLRGVLFAQGYRAGEIVTAPAR
jgi:phosphoserine phosphatase